MTILIGDAEGSGYAAGVTNENQLKTLAVTHNIQHHNSRVEGNAYQVIGDYLTLNNGTFNLLHLTNNSSTLDVVFTYIRLAVVDLTGGTAIPSSNTNFQIGFDQTYSTGGTVVTPINVNPASGKTAPVIVYDNNPTLAGTFLEIDRAYPYQQGKDILYHKEGSLILKIGESIIIRVTTDHTTGIGYCRASFIMEPAS